MTVGVAYSTNCWDYCSSAGWHARSTCTPIQKVKNQGHETLKICGFVHLKLLFSLTYERSRQHSLLRGALLVLQRSYQVCCLRAEGPWHQDV